MALEEGRFFRGNMTDKRHDADGLAEYCRRFLSSGVWELAGNLEVSAGDDLKVDVGFGAALIDGFPYRLRDNGTGLLQLAFEPAEEQPRIDRVVIRKDPYVLRVYTYIKKGEPDASPLPPPLEKENGVYEISLAQVLVAADATEIATEDITDERDDDEVCGLISGILVGPQGPQGPQGESGPQGPQGPQGEPGQAASLSDVYPIGAVYISVNSTSPATLFGGTWAAFGAGRVLVGYNGSDSDFNTSEKTGGAKTVALTTANMPSNFPTLKLASSSNTGSYSTQQLAIGRDTGTIYENTNPIATTGSSTAHNNLQPYITVYMWKRTA